MNTAGLEWFGPPERNTLRPLCVVLPSHESEKVARALVCPDPVHSEPPLFYLKGARTQLLGPRQVGPTL